MTISAGHNGTHMYINVAEAKNKLPGLIKAVEGGQPVTICRREVPVVDIVRTKRPVRAERKLGVLKGKVQILDPDWWRPMRPEGLRDFVEGRH